MIQLKLTVAASRRSTQALGEEWKVVEVGRCGARAAGKLALAGEPGAFGVHRGRGEGLVRFAVREERGALAVPIGDEGGALGLQEEQRARGIRGEVGLLEELGGVVKIARVDQAGDEQAAAASGRSCGTAAVEQADGEAILVDGKPGAALVEIGGGEVADAVARGCAGPTARPRVRCSSRLQSRW